MKQAVLFIMCSVFAGCGGAEEEVCEWSGGKYLYSAELAFKDCPDTLAPDISEQIIVNLREGNGYLACGYHQDVKFWYDMLYDCDVIHLFEVRTLPDEIVGKYTVELICLKDGLGYLLLNRAKCSDIYGLTLTPVL